MKSTHSHTISDEWFSRCYPADTTSDSSSARGRTRLEQHRLMPRTTSCLVRASRAVTRSVAGASPSCAQSELEPAWMPTSGTLALPMLLPAIYMLRTNVTWSEQSITKLYWLTLSFDEAKWPRPCANETEPLYLSIANGLTIEPE